MNKRQMSDFPEGRKKQRAGGEVVPRVFTKKPKVDTGYVDLALATYAFDTTGSITLLATIPQGASVNQRVGKRAQYKSLQIRGNWSASTTTTVADAACIVVYDRRPTGSLPAITDVLVSANSAAMNNDANSGRFKIVRRWDKQFMGNITTPTTGQEAESFDHFAKLPGLNIVFKAAGTGVIADIEEGALYLITVGNIGAGTAAVRGDLAFRTRFVDV